MHARPEGNGDRVERCSTPEGVTDRCTPKLPVEVKRAVGVLNARGRH